MLDKDLLDGFEGFERLCILRLSPSMVRNAEAPGTTNEDTVGRNVILFSRTRHGRVHPGPLFITDSRVFIRLTETRWVSHSKRLVLLDMK